MKNILYSITLVIILLSLTISYNGCSKADEVITPPADESFDKESISVKNFTTVMSVLTNANSYIIQIANRVTPTSTGCPTFGSDTISTPREFIIRYGDAPGCVSSVDVVRRSGNNLMFYSISSTRDTTSASLSFTPGFRIYKSTSFADTNAVVVTGTLNNFTSMKQSEGVYRFKCDPSEINFVTNDGHSKRITFTALNGTINTNSPSTTADDTYSVYGTASVFDGKYGITYEVSIPQSTPLNIPSNCKYPVSGVSTFSVNGVGVQCDFSPNASACDAIVKFTKGSVSKTIDLSNTDF